MKFLIMARKRLPYGQSCRFIRGANRVSSALKRGMAFQRHSHELTRGFIVIALVIALVY